MENLKSVIEGFRFSYTQMTAVFFVLLITYLINKYLVNKSLQFIDQQTLWIRYLRYWFPLFRIILWGFSIYICFSILSPPREILFATATSAGVAIGLAAQELIKNLFGSVIIWSDKLYQEGDRVLIGEVEGIVQSIGLRSTKIKAYNDTLMVIPNSKLLDAVVANSNPGQSTVPVVMDFYLPINTDPQQAMEDGRMAALSSDLIEPTKPIIVLTADLLSGDIPLTRIRIKAYVNNAKYEKMFISDVTKRAKKLFLEHDLYKGLYPPDSFSSKTGSTPLYITSD